ncbi:unnamed protein product [Bemisia tabaci]|uniref:Carboxylesterase type B domain-containing protein n=1 Tax=Bemisia tabaci TaxID=7038 RepID=A0A9P0AK98_BEMTA|nr:unnamed protein product [Bemisia tabaci]
MAQAITWRTTIFRVSACKAIDLTGQNVDPSSKRCKFLKACAASEHRMRSPLAQLLTTLLLLQASTSWGFPSRTTFHNPGHGSDGLVNDNDSPKDTRTRIVRIKQGLLRGKIVHFKNNNNLQSVEVFLGIPYAAAPVGSQRFMPPGSPPPWPGLMTADTLSPVCPQVLPDVSDNARSKMSKGRYNYFSKLLPYLKNQSEDCLYLNIYTPFQGTISFLIIYFYRKEVKPVRLAQRV